MEHSDQSDSIDLPLTPEEYIFVALKTTDAGVAYESLNKARETAMNQPDGVEGLNQYFKLLLEHSRTADRHMYDPMLVGEALLVAHEIHRRDSEGINPVDIGSLLSFCLANADASQAESVVGIVGRNFNIVELRTLLDNFTRRGLRQPGDESFFVNLAIKHGLYAELSREIDMKFRWRDVHFPDGST